MQTVLVKSPQDEAATKDLVGKSIPSYRQAYSDRTSWLMACMSELAYLRFNPFLPEGKKDKIASIVDDAISEGKKAALLDLVDQLGYDHEEEKETLEKELSYLDYELVETL